MERDKSIDAVAGLMMIVVITRHTLNWLGLSDEPFVQILLRFFFYTMPFYFFKAGMFYRDKHLNVRQLVVQGGVNS